MTDNVQHIELAHISRDKHQPRKIFDARSIKALADDITARGVIQPITVRPDPDNDGRYIIVFGERRYRASEKAGRDSIPCLVQATERDPLDRYIDQAAENIQRDGFKPLEMAQFFEDLHQRHGIKISDIPQVLKERGLRVLDRSYITNMRRLLGLPKWAKADINAERLTPAHGKYILAARELETVLDNIRQGIADYIDENDDDGQQRPPNLADLHDIIADAFDEAGHPDLYRMHRNQNSFDPEQSCKGCSHYRRIAGIASWQPAKWYCLQQTCLDQKVTAYRAELDEQRQREQAERRKANAERERAIREANARREQAAATLPPAPADDDAGNMVDDTIAAAMAGSSDSPTEPQASASDNTPPAPSIDDLPEMTDAQKRLAAGRVERTQQYLDNWLRGQLVEHLADDEATRYRVILWLAAGAPGYMVNGYSASAGDLGQPASCTYDHTRDGMRDPRDHGINLTLQGILEADQLELDIVNTAIEHLDRDNLRRLAHHVGIELEGRYSISREYLEIKSRLELLESTPIDVRQCFGNWSKQTRGAKASELVDWLLEWPRQYGVPADLAAMYAASAPTVSQETTEAA